MTWEIIGDLTLHQIQALFSGVGLAIIILLGLIACLTTRCVVIRNQRRNVKDHLDEAARIEIYERDVEIKQLKAENEKLEAYCEGATYLLKAAAIASHKTSEILAQIKATVREFKTVKRAVKESPFKEKAK